MKNKILFVASLVLAVSSVTYAGTKLVEIQSYQNVASIIFEPANNVNPIRVYKYVDGDTGTVCYISTQIGSVNTQSISCVR